MSDLPTDYRDRLNLAELVSRIERQQEETRKFVSEQHKLESESGKLASEARKLDRDRYLAPWLAIIGIIGGVITVGSLILRAVGIGH